MFGWKRYGIRLKLYGTFLVVSLLFATFAFAALEIEARTSRRAALLEAQNVASAIAITGLEDPLGNPGFLQRYVMQVHGFYSRDLFILDVGKRILADSEPGEIGRVYTGDPENEVGRTIRDGLTRTFVEASGSFGGPRHTQEVVVPFRSNAGDAASPIIGAVVFEYTQIYDELIGQAKPMLYLTGGVGFVLLLLTAALGMRVASIISRQIGDLQKGAARLASGELGTQVAVTADDELGELAVSFNRMSEDLRAGGARLQERLSELGRSNQRLNEEVHERKRAEEQLAYLARFDTLTGLPNRHMVHDHLAQALAQAKRSGQPLACMFIDLDRFKAVNDTYGHGVGDLLLGQMATRLKRCVRASDTVGRLGGDEFAVILPILSSPEDAGRVAQKIVDALSVPFDLEGRETYSSASIGIAVYPGDGAEVEVLLAKADMAMYRSKQRGRNNYHFYLPLMNEEAAQRLNLENGLRGALERGEFELHYQPKADLRAGTLNGFEALLRWRHPERGLVPPAEFIPVLEEIGLISAVGDWVLATVCAQLGAWQAQGLRPPPVAINLSARQLQQADFDGRASGIVRAHGIDPGLIEFEITESMLMRSPEEAAGLAAKLKRTGFKLAVDDFGTGYSSLAYLQRFPLDTLKIDRVFVRDVITDPNNAVIILAIIGLAHSLKLKVVAEGVETAEQLRFLRAHGCDGLQGYYFARPQTVADAGRSLAGDIRLAILPEAGAGAAPRVLLVDDNPADLELIGKALKSEGYDVLAETDPRVALQALSRESFLMVISDHAMPHMSGVVFMSHVRNLSPHSLRIVISGSGGVEAVAEAVNTAGIHRYISKGWSSERMRAEVRGALFQGRPDPYSAVSSSAQVEISLSSSSRAPRTE